MALEFDAVMLVVGVPRGTASRGTTTMVCADVIDPRDYGDRPDAVKAITQRGTAALEG